MRLLLIFLAIPGIALAQGQSVVKNRIGPTSVSPTNVNLGAGFGGALQAPVMISPPAGYPTNGQLGNYQLPINYAGGQYPVCFQGMCRPALPPYLAFYNRGIPNFNGPNQPATAFNILPYNQQLPGQSPFQQRPQQSNNPLQSLLSALGGGGPGGANNRGGSNNGSYGSYEGSNSGGNFSGTPVNSGHDGLCYQPGLFQTTAKAELGGRTPCQVISDTIRDSCTGRFSDSLAEGHLDGMEEFCPGWDRLKVNEDTRNRVLTALVAATVRTESSWRTDTAGDGGRSKGMLQLTIASDRGKGCSCGDLTNEFNMGQNLRCGTHMIISYMAKDRTVGRGYSESTARGIARSFGPYRDGRGERGDIIRRVSGYCRMLQNNPQGLDNPEAIPMSQFEIDPRPAFDLAQVSAP